MNIDLKLKFSQYPSIHTNYIISHPPLYNIIIIVDTVLRQKRIRRPQKLVRNDTVPSSVKGTVLAGTEL